MAVLLIGPAGAAAAEPVDAPAHAVSDAVSDAPSDVPSGADRAGPTAVDLLAQTDNGVFELTDLVVEVVAEGNGPASEVGQTLVVEFTSWIMENGEPAREFDSTTARGGPWEFVLGQNQALKGWDAGLKGMRVGATRRITMPPEMAYGKRGFAGPTAFVPPGAWVMSEVTLLEIR